MSQTRYQSSGTMSIPTFPVNMNGEGLKFAIAVARFNSHITTPLLEGAYETLKENGVLPEHIQIVWVPGAFELPLACFKLAETHRYAAVIALGCVIRGETTHYDYVCNEAARGITEANFRSNVPVMFGVVTTENLEQAEARVGFNGGENKGSEVALAALEMANLHRKISSL